MSKTKTATITTIEELKSMTASELVELPGWQPGQTVTFRLRRSSLRVMTKLGKIPNPLLAAAQRLYEGASGGTKASFAEIIKVMDLVVRNSMVEPTLDQLDEAGIELTEDQFGAIWTYAQKGAAGLEPFRKQPADSDHDSNGENVEGAAQ